jgi:hypothetical protein
MWSCVVKVVFDVGLREQLASPPPDTLMSCHPDGMCMHCLETHLRGSDSSRLIALSRKTQKLTAIGHRRCLLSQRGSKRGAPSSH